MSNHDSHFVSPPANGSLAELANVGVSTIADAMTGTLKLAEHDRIGSHTASAPWSADSNIPVAAPLRAR